jgi:hypothetical protein
LNAATAGPDVISPPCAVAVILSSDDPHCCTTGPGSSTPSRTRVVAVPRLECPPNGYSPSGVKTRTR